MLGSPLSIPLPPSNLMNSMTSIFLFDFSVTPLDVVKIRLQAQQKALLSNKCFLYCNGLMDHLCPCVTSAGGHTNWYHRNGQFNGTIVSSSTLQFYHTLLYVLLIFHVSAKLSFL